MGGSSWSLVCKGSCSCAPCGIADNDSSRTAVARGVAGDDSIGAHTVGSRVAGNDSIGAHTVGSRIAGDDSTGPDTVDT